MTNKEKSALRRDVKYYLARAKTDAEIIIALSKKGVSQNHYKKIH